MNGYNKQVLSAIPIGVVLALILTMTTGNAQNSDSFQLCLDNTTLNVSNAEVRCINGVCKDFSMWETTFCANGCDLENNVCNPEGFNVFLIGGIFVIVMLVVLVVFLKVIK